MADTEPDPGAITPQNPGVFRYVVGFLLVGAAWGMTSPFIRRAAVDYTPPKRTVLEDPTTGRVKKLVLKVLYAVFDLLKRPSYAIPLLINLTGSIWFFLLIGQAELSLTVPIINSLAFLFTVLGEYLAEGKTVSRDTWIGMAMVCGGIALCVQSKL
ncbi:integral membrane protein [Kalaharituber pfeilii]|nr:integral membrane protein [Kalaharituber pfeilii]